MRALVLAVLIVCVIAGVSLTSFTIEEGCGCHTTINIATPQMDHREEIDTNAWDAMLFINKITPKDERAPWKELRIVVKSMDGRVLIEHSRLEANDPAGYYPLGSWDSQVRFWYIEAGDNQRLDALDSIVISGLSQEYEGATIEISKAGERIGSITLPSGFE